MAQAISSSFLPKFQTNLKGKLKEEEERNGCNFEVEEDEYSLKKALRRGGYG